MSLPGDDEVAGAEMRRDFVEHDFVQIFFLVVGPRRQFPFRDVRIDEHRSVGEAFAVILRVQRAEADRHFAFHDALVFQDRDAAEIAVECLVVDRRLAAFRSSTPWSLAEVFRPPRSICRSDRHPCRAAICRSATKYKNARHFRRIEHRHAIHQSRLAIGDGLLGGAPIHDRGKDRDPSASSSLRRASCAISVL